MAIWDRFTKKRKRKIRNYKATQGGGLFADWMSGSLSADSAIRFNLRKIRDRCREQARNNDYAKRYLQLLVTNVVGQNGIRIQSKARNADNSIDKIGNQIIENNWNKWCKRGNCTVDGRMSFLDAQKLFIETLARDGEVLVRHIKTRNKEQPYKIQFLDADYLDEEKDEVLNNDGEIIMGVKLDKFKKPVSYFLFAEHPHKQGFGKYDRTHIEVSANELLHSYVSERPEQTRGVPFMTTSLDGLKMLDGYLEAELVASRVAASKMGFFTSPAGDGYVGDGDDDFNPIMNAEAGSFEQLPDGMDFKQFDPQHPTSGFDSFHKSVLRGIASGLGVSYVSLANNLEGVNYSSIRQGTLEERDNFRILQKFMIEHFIEPVFNQWLLSQMSFNPTFPLPADKFDKFADNIMYVPRSWGWIDPVKEVKANVDGLNAGVITMQDVQTNYGRDVEELFEQHEREEKLAEQYGIKTAYQPFGAQKMPVDAEIQQADEDE
ncbi:MAG: putative portal protein [Prokaryotic dsDNA virus sp.]|nr:MAG: putative portal protein [Prokaryotic dsDNA virus sp.]|tara:strand:- start:551 stop:2020 length:1470 start_codon:yes stop_codon:yes gene_type:complete